MPTFSIILPTRDRQELLDEAVRSVLDQTVDDFELIVVDDAGDTPARVPPDPRITLVRHEENRGVAAARNTGIEHATAEFLAFIDDDDRFDPCRLEMALEGLGSAPVALCWARYVGEPPAGRLLRGRSTAELLSDTAPHLGATAVRRDVAQRFDTNYRGAEDVEWWIRMSTQPVWTVPRVGYWMRRHSGPRVGNGVRERVDGSRRMLQEHAAFFTEHPAAAAFRWRRIGLMEGQLGNRSAAARALLRSLRLAPRARTVVALARLVRSREHGDVRSPA